MSRRRIIYENYLRTIVDAVPDVLFAQDTAGRIRMANRATAEVLGLPLDSIIGRTHSEVTRHPEDVADLQSQIDGVLASGKPNTVERVVKHPVTGEETWFETRAFPLEPPSGGAMQALVIATDITDRRRADEMVRRSQQDTLTRLAEAAEFRDDETGEHTRRVGRLAGQLARMIGLSDTDVALLEQAAPLHDIGKIGIPDSILLKPGPLSPEEFEVMKGHTVIGAKLLAGGTSPLVEMAEKIALLHHERWDGSGYPHGLREDETPALARVVWVADVVDALGHARPYRPAWPLDRIIEELREKRGSKYGPLCVDACLELLTSEEGRNQWIEDTAQVEHRAGIGGHAAARPRSKPVPAFSERSHPA